MTVTELIEELKKHDGDMVVKLEDWTEQYREPGGLAEIDKVDNSIVLYSNGECDDI